MTFDNEICRFFSFNNDKINLRMNSKQSQSYVAHMTLS